MNAETRQVREIATIRRLAATVALASACVWWTAIATSSRVVALVGVGPPLALVLAGTAGAVFAVATAGWVRPRALLAACGASAALCAGAAVAGGPAVWAGLAAATASAALACGAAVRRASDAVPLRLRSAALGFVGASAAAGLACAYQVSLATATTPAAAAWLTVYAGAGAACAWAAGRTRSRDVALARSRTQAAPAALLDVRGLEVRFARSLAIRDVSLTLDAGEVLAILGTNGAGKTTLLRTVAGFVRPTRGVVLACGEDVAGALPEELAHRGVTFVDGARPVFPGLSVAEHMALASVAARRSRGDARRAAQICWDLFPALAKRRRALAGTLSGGEQRILAIAQTIGARPRLLLVDELTLGLAEPIVADLHAAVRALARSGTAVAVVEHRIDLAVDVATRAVFLDDGVLRYDGAPSGLLERADLLRPVLLS